MDTNQQSSLPPQESSLTPPNEAQVPTPKNILNQYGFVPIVIGVIVVILVVGIGAYYLGQRSSKAPQPTNQQQPYPSTTPLQTMPTTTQSNQVVKLSDAWSLGKKVYSSPKIDIQKENADWAAKYKNSPEVRQPLYTSTFYATFSTTPNDPSAPVNREICDNKMSVSVQKFDNPKNLSLYDFIADSHKTYPGDGITQTFETYKKDLKPTTLPKEGSYVFEGIVGENPVKTVYFTNKGNVYTFGLIGNCDTGGQYTPEADKVLQNILQSIKYL